jgi:hypothetical protein
MLQIPSPVEVRGALLTECVLLRFLLRAPVLVVLLPVSLLLLSLLLPCEKILTSMAVALADHTRRMPPFSWVATPSEKLFAPKGER